MARAALGRHRVHGFRRLRLRGQEQTAVSYLRLHPPEVTPAAEDAKRSEVSCMASQRDLDPRAERCPEEGQISHQIEHLVPDRLVPSRRIPPTNHHCVLFTCPASPALRAQPSNVPLEREGSGASKHASKAALVERDLELPLKFRPKIKLYP